MSGAFKTAASMLTASLTEYFALCVCVRAAQACLLLAMACAHNNAEALTIAQHVACRLVQGQLQQRQSGGTGGAREEVGAGEVAARADTPYGKKRKKKNKDKNKQPDAVAEVQLEGEAAAGGERALDKAPLLGLVFAGAVCA